MTMIAMITPVASAPVRPSSSVPAIADGKPATMPEKMISEMPLPMPRAVICSPSHIRNIVPPTSVITVEIRKNQPGSATIPLPLSSPTEMPVGLKRRQKDGAVARVLVDDLAALLAFLLQLLERGNYRRHQLDGNRGRDVGHDAEREDRHALTAPPENMLNMPRMPPDWLERLREGIHVKPGKRDVGSEPVDEQRPSVNQMRFLSSSALAKAPKFKIGSKLFCCGCH
jgi:hypothetical protein